MNDLIVFAVGFLVSMLVVYSMFPRVVVEMQDSKVAGKETARTSD